MKQIKNKNWRARGKLKYFSRLNKRLAHHDIELEIITVAQSGSVYCCFKDKPWLGKLRIGDHPEKICLGYRWHMRMDLQNPEVLDEKGHRQFLYSPAHYGEMCGHIINYDRKCTEGK